MNAQKDEKKRILNIIRTTDQGVVISVLVQPRAVRTECVGLHGDALKFRLSAPPVDGMANETLCAYLTKLFKVSRGSVVLCSGKNARRKRVLIKGVSVDEVQEKLIKKS